eukprot:TRINITY_DN35402_c0_g1_i1.p1 TRINITY_DN35402_c0_g1~~TRINITY_DN35402_c0_g1_i1.p1  ORF type:complete len:329 (+),score=31.24 TRINITY_DN35402_c0_g1_i1:102-1088(+)
MFVSQRFWITVCVTTYAVHMMSIPFWLLVSGRSLYKQRCKGGASEYEYWAVRLYFVMAIADGVRGVDGLFDTLEDGSFVSVWGRATIGARFVAWWIRDLLGFLIILIFHEFTSKWTRTALGISQCWRSIYTIRCAFVAATIGFAVSLYGVLRTNLQVWQAFCMLAVLPYNAVSCFMCGQHLWGTMPRLSMDRNNTEMASFVGKSRRTAMLLFVCHAIMLSAFPLLILQKVAIGQNPLVAHLPTGSWLGSTYLKVITDLPEMLPQRSPSPALEIVEISMGWLSLFLWWPLDTTKGSMTSGKCNDQYVAAETIGRRLQAFARTADQVKVD